jgi:hypothetical protein
MLCPQTNCKVLHFHTNKTCLNVSLLRFGQVVLCVVKLCVGVLWQTAVSWARYHFTKFMCGLFNCAVCSSGYKVLSEHVPGKELRYTIINLTLDRQAHSPGMNPVPPTHKSEMCLVMCHYYQFNLISDQRADNQTCGRAGVMLATAISKPAVSSTIYC